MGDHELPDDTPAEPVVPEPEPAPVPPPVPVVAAVQDVIESKVIVSSLVTLVAGCAAAVLNEVETNATLLGGLPPWAQALVLCLVPPLLTFAGGYATTSNRV